jgi:hypothetical protein
MNGVIIQWIQNLNILLRSDKDVEDGDWLEEVSHQGISLGTMFCPGPFLVLFHSVLSLVM